MPAESLRDFSKFLGAKLFLMEQVVLRAAIENPTNKLVKDILKDIQKISHGSYEDIVGLMTVKDDRE